MLHPCSDHNTCRTASRERHWDQNIFMEVMQFCMKIEVYRWVMYVFSTNNFQKNGVNITLVSLHCHIFKLLISTSFNLYLQSLFRKRGKYHSNGKTRLLFLLSTFIKWETKYAFLITHEDTNSAHDISSETTKGVKGIHLVT